MRVFKISDDAKLPTKKDGDRAYDLYSIDTKEVRFGEVVPIRTGIKISFPNGVHGILKPRSGLALNHGIHILGGVIDSGYTGEIIVLVTKLKSEKNANLFESKETPFLVEKGMKICQMKLEKDLTLDIEQVFNEEELGNTDRGEKGFGSSGNI